MCPRRRLGAFCCALALLGAGPAVAQPAERRAPQQIIGIAAYVAEASQRFGLPERWIDAVIRVESAGRAGAVSSAGAMGLMQLMPGTWVRQRARFGLGSDPFDPRDNILAGTSYLREMYDLYGSTGFLAAYNAGPGRYREWRDKGRPLPAETRAYVVRLASMLQDDSISTAFATSLPVRPVSVSWTEAALFANRADKSGAAPSRDADPAPRDSSASPNRPASGLFAPLSGDHPR